MFSILNSPWHTDNDKRLWNLCMTIHYSGLFFIELRNCGEVWGVSKNDF